MVIKAAQAWAWGESHVSSKQFLLVFWCQGPYIGASPNMDLVSKALLPPRTQHSTCQRLWSLLATSICSHCISFTSSFRLPPSSIPVESTATVNTLVATRVISIGLVFSCALLTNLQTTDRCMEDALHLTPVVKETKEVEYIILSVSHPPL